MGAKGTLQETRCGDEAWVNGVGFAALKARLPLCWPAPAELLACPKRRMRSGSLSSSPYTCPINLKAGFQPNFAQTGCRKTPPV